MHKMTDMGLTYQSDKTVVKPWNHTATAASRTITIPKTQTVMDVLSILLKMGPLRQNMSRTAIISKLNRLLPNAAPMAKSGVPTMETALIPVPISGNDVAVANITIPTKDLPRPVFKAITSADFVRKLEAPKIIKAARKSSVHKRVMLILVKFLN